jgi:hypothetical protein
MNDDHMNLSMYVYFVILFIVFFLLGANIVVLSFVTPFYLFFPVGVL